MASLTKYGKYWRVTFRRKSNRKDFYFRQDRYSKTRITTWMNERQLEFDAGTWAPWEAEPEIDDTALTLKEAAAQYKPVAKRTLAESTYAVRIGYINEFTTFAGQNRTLTKLSDLPKTFVNKKGAYNTKRKRKTCLNRWFTFLKQKGHIETLPDLEILSTKAERKRSKNKYKTYVRPSEFDAVKAAARALHKENSNTNIGGSPKYKKYRDFEQEFPYVFDFLINTAIRKADLLNLNTDWFEGKYMRIGGDRYLPKSKEIERIPLTPKAREIAERWIEKYGHSTRPFKNITPDWYTKFFKAVFRKALPDKSDKLSAHKMRDSAAMYLLHEKGYSSQTVQQITRHEDISTLNIYLHRNPESALNEIENKAG